VSYPLRDSGRNLVVEDRREQADRRTGLLESEWQEIMKDTSHSSIERPKKDRRSSRHDGSGPWMQHQYHGRE